MHTFFSCVLWFASLDTIVPVVLLLVHYLLEDTRQANIDFTSTPDRHSSTQGHCFSFLLLLRLVNLVISV